MLDVEIGGIWSVIDLPSFKFQQLHKRQSELVRKAKYVSNIYIFLSLGISVLYLLAESGRLDPLCFGEFFFSFIFPFLSPPRFTGSAFPSSEQVRVFLAGWYLWLGVSWHYILIFIFVLIILFPYVTLQIRGFFFYDYYYFIFEENRSPRFTVNLSLLRNPVA